MSANPYSSHFTLPPKHRFLLESFGIAPEQVLIVPSVHELRETARRMLDPRDYADGVVGICLRPDAALKLPDPQIVLVWPVDSSVHALTGRRLNSYGLAHTANYWDASQRDWLLAFLILHEIAHFQLGHGKNAPPTVEFEADRWAHSELLKRYDQFGPQRVS